MKKKWLKYIATITTSLLIIGVITSCDNKSKESMKNEDVTLSYWMQLNTTLSKTTTDAGELPYFKELEKRTGIKIDIVHPAQGQEKEQLNMKIASNDLPDMIFYEWNTFTSSYDSLIEQKIAVKLNDNMQKYAPNLKKVLKDNMDWDKQVKTDSGAYVIFPFLRQDGLSTWYGPVIRKDWLEELKLEVPTTISQWENVLREFKEKKNADAPLGIPFGLLTHGQTISGAFGVPDQSIVSDAFYVENGKIKYGPIEPGYKEFLTVFIKWYQEGLIDKEYVSQDGKAFDAKVTSGRTGILLTSAGAGIGKYTQLMQKQDPNVKFEAIPNPTLGEGETPKFGHNSFNFEGIGTIITTSCKNVEKAMQWLDYGYGEEGHMLNNFGIEGESYKTIDGYPKYTEMITNNPEGLEMPFAMARYMRSNYSGSFVQDKRYYEQYLTTDSQKRAVELWLKHDDSRRVPPITLTAQESEKFTEIMSDIRIFIDEEKLKFITGQRSINGFDEFVARLKNLGIEEAVKIKQDALDRYNKK